MAETPKDLFNNDLKNNDEIVLREPKEILDEMKVLDIESETILKTIRDII